MTPSLESEFLSYLESCELENPSPGLVKAMRQTFMAGVLVTFYLHDEHGVAKREILREVERWRAEANEEADLWRRRN